LDTEVRRAMVKINFLDGSVACGVDRGSAESLTRAT
jgi:hypothetical protein